MKRFLAYVFLCGCGGSGPSPVKGQPAAFTQPDTKSPMSDANFSCLHAFVDGAPPTTPTTVQMEVDDFQSGDPVENATVDVFLSLQQVNSGVPAASSSPTDRNGKTSLVVPPGAFRVIFRTTSKPVNAGDPQKTIETFEFNRKYNDANRISVSTVTKTAIVSFVNVVQDDALGVVAGAQRDCDNKEVGGAIMTLSSSGGSYKNEGNVFYFVKEGSTDFPSTSQLWTSGDGVFAGLNVPPGDVTVKSYATTGGKFQELGAVVVPVHANSITIVEMQPIGPPTKDAAL